MNVTRSEKYVVVSTLSMDLKDVGHIVEETKFEMKEELAEAIRKELTTCKDFVGFEILYWKDGTIIDDVNEWFAMKLTARFYYRDELKVTFTEAKEAFPPIKIGMGEQRKDGEPFVEL